MVAPAPDEPTLAATVPAATPASQHAQPFPSSRGVAQTAERERELGTAQVVRPVGLMQGRWIGGAENGVAGADGSLATASSLGSARRHAACASKPRPCRRARQRRRRSGSRRSCSVGRELLQLGRLVTGDWRLGTGVRRVDGVGRRYPDDHEGVFFL